MQVRVPGPSLSTAMCCVKQPIKRYQLNVGGCHNAEDGASVVHNRSVHKHLTLCLFAKNNIWVFPL
jgi:hypothetical protein